MYEFDASDFGPLEIAPVVVNQTFFYPNPFSDAGTLWFPNKDGYEHELSIYDLQGKRVRTYSNLTGQYVTIKRGDLRQGVYFYSLVFNGYIKDSGKFVVVKP